MNWKFDGMKLIEGIVYYGLFLIGIVCAYALFTRQLGPQSYQYFGLGLIAVLGIVVGLCKIYDDVT